MEAALIMKSLLPEGGGGPPTDRISPKDPLCRGCPREVASVWEPEVLPGGNGHVIKPQTTDWLCN